MVDISAGAEDRVYELISGRERTEDEFEALLAPAGLRLVRKTALPSGMWVLEAQGSGSPRLTKPDS